MKVIQYLLSFPLCSIHSVSVRFPSTSWLYRNHSCFHPHSCSEMLHKVFQRHCVVLASAILLLHRSSPPFVSLLPTRISDGAPQGTGLGLFLPRSHVSMISSVASNQHICRAPHLNNQLSSPSTYHKNSRAIEELAFPTIYTILLFISIIAISFMHPPLLQTYILQLFFFSAQSPFCWQVRFVLYLVSTFVHFHTFQLLGLFVCVCLSVCVYVCFYICLYVFVCVYMGVSTCLCICVYIFLCVCVCVFLCVSVCFTLSHVCVNDRMLSQYTCHAQTASCEISSLPAFQDGTSVSRLAPADPSHHALHPHCSIFKFINVARALLTA